MLPVSVATDLLHYSDKSIVNETNGVLQNCKLSQAPLPRGKISIYKPCFFSIIIFNCSNWKQIESHNNTKQVLFLYFQKTLTQTDFFLRNWQRVQNISTAIQHPILMTVAKTQNRVRLKVKDWNFQPFSIKMRIVLLHSIVYLKLPRKYTLLV